MAIDWTYNLRKPETLEYRLDRAMRSIPDVFVIAGVDLASGENSFPHGGGARHVVAVLRGTSPAIGVSVGEIGPTHVKVYAESACTVDLHVTRAR